MSMCKALLPALSVFAVAMMVADEARGHGGSTSNQAVTCCRNGDRWVEVEFGGRGPGAPPAFRQSRPY
jgi:hypothetical protein